MLHVSCCTFVLLLYEAIPILLKITTRVKLFLFWNSLGDYSYSFQGSSGLISITVTVSLLSSRTQLQERIPLRN